MSKDADPQILQIQTSVIPDPIKFLIHQHMMGEWDGARMLTDGQLIRTNITGYERRLFPYFDEGTIVGRRLPWGMVTTVWVRYKKKKEEE